MSRGGFMPSLGSDPLGDVPGYLRSHIEARGNGSSAPAPAVVATPAVVTEPPIAPAPLAVEAPPADEPEALTGARIEEARVARGWSKLQLAKASGLAWSTVRNVIERGTEPFTNVRLRRSAEHLWATLQQADDVGDASESTESEEETEVAAGAPTPRRARASTRRAAPAPVVDDVATPAPGLTRAHVEALASFLPPTEVLETARRTPGLTLTPACELALEALQQLREQADVLERGLDQRPISHRSN
ncbi:helix-turn-helix domain-containing protein [Roseisolibacter agri]|uniref:Uncharacterized protein n=1 Tax=Roseisolibacter agri TaxID=2014610 RepID=A0AA37V2C0_9BACT|nr:helix-turn-helix transcriptional regulator [Roseisolibacter agri]GLC25032.1 hypothetical protein rosag_15450 [Roseisolibacter agri]